ncbi:MAG: V-type ATP synthase subunit D, partial [Filifactor alocis]|nr:V-type ATP synthase subunit D [Filifactor alocis]
TNEKVDIAVMKFKDLRYLIYELAEIENAVFKISMEIKKTAKRANALQKIQIPKYEEAVKYIQEVIEEKEREDFFRLKKIKGKKVQNEG